MAKDLFHQVVKGGWNITHDPFPIDYGDVLDFYIPHLHEVMSSLSLLFFSR